MISDVISIFWYDQKNFFDKLWSIKRSNVITDSRKNARNKPIDIKYHLQFLPFWNGWSKIIIKLNQNIQMIHILKQLILEEWLNKLVSLLPFWLQHYTISSRKIVWPQLIKSNGSRQLKCHNNKLSSWLPLFNAYVIIKCMIYNGSQNIIFQFF